MADFVHRIPAVFAFEKKARDSHDEAGNISSVAICVNNSAGNVDARGRLCAGVDEPAFFFTRGTGAVIPKINGEIRRPGESKIIILPDVLVRPARHARIRPRGTSHQRLETGGNFVHAKQFVQAAARVFEHRQGFHANTRQPGNFKNSAHFDWLPDCGHGRPSYLNSFHLCEHFFQAGTPQTNWMTGNSASFSLSITMLRTTHGGVTEINLDLRNMQNADASPALVWIFNEFFVAIILADFVPEDVNM